MELLNIEIKNIRGVLKKKYQFDKELTLVRGENMTGKTSIFYAIKFALFGVSGVNLTAPELFNKQGGTPFVSLVFQVGGDIYRVERGKSKAELFKEGEEVPIAVGNSVVTSYIKNTLNSNGKHLVITASSVVEMLHPALLEENTVDINGFRTLTNILSNIKTYIKYFKEELIDLPIKSAPSLSEIQLQEEDNRLVSQRREEVTAEINKLRQSLRVAEKKEELQRRIGRGTDVPTREMIGKMKRYRELANYANCPVIPKDYLVLREKWDAYQRCSGIPEDIFEQYEAASKLYEEAVKYEEWERNAPVKPETHGKSIIELEDIYTAYLKVMEAKEELETGVCSACGTTLNESQVSKAKKILAENEELPSWAARANTLVKRLREYEVYPEAPKAPEVSKREAQNNLSSLEGWLVRAKENDCSNREPEPSEELSPELEKVLPSDADERWLDSYNRKVEEVATLPPCTESEYQKMLVVVSDIEELNKLPDVSPVEVLIRRIQELEATPFPELVDTRSLRRQYEEAKQVEEERRTITANLVLFEEFNKALKEAIKKVQDRVWDTLLANATAFCSDITEGKVYHIGKNEKGFYYMEDGMAHSVTTGSGLQRSLIGLSLQITRKIVSGDTLPLLLDEVTGRMSDKYRDRFINKLTTLPYQCVLITHTKESGETLEITET